MIRWLLLSLLLVEALMGKILHILVMDPCLNCVKVWKESGLFVPEHFGIVQMAHRAWEANQSQLITKGVSLLFLQQRDAPTSKIVLEEGWTIVVEREFISLSTASWSDAQKQLEECLQEQIAPAMHALLVKPDWLMIPEHLELPENISIVEASKFEQSPEDVVKAIVNIHMQRFQEPTSTTTQVEDRLFKAVMDMCEGPERWMRMNEFQLVMAAGQQHRARLLTEFEPTIGVPCETYQNHVLFALACAAVVGWVLWDCYLSYKLHQKPYGPI